MFDLFTAALIFGSLTIIANGIVLVLAFIEYFRSSSIDQWISMPQTLSGSTQKPHVLMIHGFGGSPNDVRPLATTLNSNGFRVVVPVLPFQTRTSNPISRIRNSIDLAMSELREMASKELNEHGVRPVCVGFSMGGTLAAQIAREGYFSKIVLIAPFFGNTKLCRIARLLKFIVPLSPKLSSGQINSPAGRRSYVPGTRFLSLFAFSELCTFAEAVLSRSSEISIPVLVFASPGDKAASFSITKAKLVNRSNVEMIQVDGANHVLLFDYKSDDVQKRTLAFLLSAPSEIA